MTHQEEQYVHFVSSTDKLNNAWRILREIKCHKGHPLVGAAFQFALIEYSKPYTVSYGAELNTNGKPKNKYLLDDTFIPARYRALHESLVKARNQIYAHDDLSVKEAKIHVANSGYGNIVGVSQNIIYGTENFARVDEILELIEQTLENMYVEIKRLEAALPVTS